MSKAAMVSSWIEGRWWIAGLVIAWMAASTAAADSPSLAAPGDCAQPSRDLDPGPVLPAVSSGGVAGPPASHFAPVAILGNAITPLPSDLTRTTVQTVDAVAAQATSPVNETTSVLGDPASLLQSDPGSVPLLSDPGSVQLLNDPGSVPLLNDPGSVMNNPSTAPVLQPVFSTLDGALK